ACGELSIDHPRYLYGLERLSGAIKAHTCRAFIQLLHTGRQTSSFITGVQPVAPSALACPTIKEIPRALNSDEIKMLEKKFIMAARYAHIAGFDGVEIHAAHGYLINQFLSAYSNIRNDEYGGSLDKRMKFLQNIVKGIKDEVPELALSIRLNIDDFIPGGLIPAESILIAIELEKAGADVIHCSCGTYQSGLTSIEPSSYEEGWRAYLAAQVKQKVKIPVIGGGVIRSPEIACELIRKKQADFVFIGRSFIADSEWANKTKENRAEEIRPCIMCNNCIENTFIGITVDCTVNPWMGRERFLHNPVGKRIKRAQAVVAGSGPAGMQAALSLCKQGIQVRLLEKEEKLGGMLNLAAIPPYKQRIALLRDYLIKQLKTSGAEIILNKLCDAEELEKMPADYIVIATGSKAVMPAIKGWNSNFCKELSDILNRKVEISNKQVIIIGGGRSGCELADFLTTGHNQVTIVEEKKVLAAGMEKKNRRDLMDRLQKEEVIKKTGSNLLEIREQGAVIQNQNGQLSILDADYIVMAAGYTPSNELYRSIQQIHKKVYLIGDAFGIGGIKQAITHGEMLAQSIGRHQLMNEEINEK
ncbi:MAG: FAD-dependent oxidoreductase, partial [Syntrophomonadaceae bacterium]|nr:FAD-dependent oxidoreductase [Syntrophomonadaceae bacterium]